MNVDIANRLLQLRKEHELSQEDLAEKLGVTRQAVSKWERAEASPDTDNLVRLARIYNVSLDALLMGGLDAEEEAAFDPRPQREPLEALEDDEPEDIPLAKPIHTQEQPASRVNDQIEFNMGDMRFRFKWRSFPYPIVVVVVYMLLGIWFNWWHPAWLLFLTIPLYYTMPDFAHEPDRIKALKRFPYPVLVVLVYLCAGVFYDWWHPGWLLFLTIPLYYIFLDHAV